MRIEGVRCSIIKDNTGVPFALCTSLFFDIYNTQYTCNVFSHSINYSITFANFVVSFDCTELCLVSIKMFDVFCIAINIFKFNVYIENVWSLLTVYYNSRAQHITVQAVQSKSNSVHTAGMF